jgi:hypothetical protein
MTARDVLETNIDPAVPADMAKASIDDFAAEVVADRDTEIMRWLGKKAREYRTTGRKADRERADLILSLASKISRGAVRPNNTRLPADVSPTFFEPGRSYTRGRWHFICLSVAAAPWDGQVRATGFLDRGDGTGTVHGMTRDDWENDGWTEVTTAPEVTG